MANSSNVQLELIEWNSRTADTYIPSTVIQTFYILLGVLGNILVFVVYRQRTRNNHGDRLFIIALAIVDFFGCIFSTTLSLLYNVVSVIFPSSAACKILHFGASTCIVSSLFLLFVISIERFLKLCRPLGPQLNKRRKRILVAVVLILGSVMSVPIPILNDRMEFRKKDSNIVGYVCRSPSRPSLQTVSDVYHGLLMVIEVIVLIVMCVLYVFVGKTLVQHFSGATKGQAQQHAQDVDPQMSTDMTDPDSCDSKRSLERSQDTKSSKKSLTGSARKYTLIFLLITIVAIVCYIPPLVILFLETKNKNFWHDKSRSLQLTLNIIRRLYIVNHVANPFIYAFCDREFRDELKRLLSVFRKWKA